MRTLIWDMFEFEMPVRYPSGDVMDILMCELGVQGRGPGCQHLIFFFKSQDGMRSPRERVEVEKGQGPQIKPWGIPTISGQRDEKESAEETEAWLVM